MTIFPAWGDVEGFVFALDGARGHSSHASFVLKRC